MQATDLHAAYCLDIFVLYLLTSYSEAYNRQTAWWPACTHAYIRQYLLRFELFGLVSEIITQLFLKLLHILLLLLGKGLEHPVIFLLKLLQSHKAYSENKGRTRCVRNWLYTNCGNVVHESDFEKVQNRYIDFVLASSVGQPKKSSHFCSVRPIWASQAHGLQIHVHVFFCIQPRGSIDPNPGRKDGKKRCTYSPKILAESSIFSSLVKKDLAHAVKNVVGTRYFDIDLPEFHDQIDALAPLCPSELLWKGFDSPWAPRVVVFSSPSSPISCKEKDPQLGLHYTQYYAPFLETTALLNHDEVELLLIAQCFQTPDLESFLRFAWKKRTHWQQSTNVIQLLPGTPRQIGAHLTCSFLTRWNLLPLLPDYFPAGFSLSSSDHTDGISKKKTPKKAGLRADA